MNTTKETTIDFWVIKADYTRSIGKEWKLETGAKFNRSDINNVLGVEKQLEDRFIQDTAMSSKAVLYENIGAVYGNLSGKFRKKQIYRLGSELKPRTPTFKA